MPNATPVSAAIAEKARKFVALAVQTISRVGQNTIADELRLSGPTISRFVAEDLERACQVLAAAGLKVVPADMRCYPEAQIEAIFTLAKSHMQALDSAEKLSFEEE